MSKAIKLKEESDLHDLLLVSKAGILLHTRNIVVCHNKAVYDTSICRSIHQPGKSSVTHRTTCSILITKVKVTHRTSIIKCGIRFPVSWMASETRASMRTKEQRQTKPLIHVTLVNINSALGLESRFRFLSALYPCQITGYCMTVEVTICCVCMCDASALTSSRID
jgi:hypothetical protein